MIEGGLVGLTLCEAWEKREHRPAIGSAMCHEGSVIVP